MIQFELDFLTPLFSAGAYSDQPEIRPASIRGQLHWWFRAVGGDFSNEQEIFGGIGRSAKASKVVVRISDIDGSIAENPTLPHKHGGAASRRVSYESSTRCSIHILERLGGLTEPQRALFLRALEAWLQMGSLGYRSTRAGGNFLWQPINGNCPFSPCSTLNEYEARCHTILQGTKLKFALCPTQFTSAESARVIITDTIGGHNDHAGKNDLESIRQPLGFARSKSRKTSPLRFRIIYLEEAYYIIALWDDRSEVTGNSSSDLGAILNLLADSGKDIGRLFKDLTFS